MVERFPDFIIGGAPKCGTTSLHFVLDQHPMISLPEDELHYFDADDPITHPDFFFHQNGDLVHYDNRPNSAAFRRRYTDRFAKFPEAAMLGEDSTTYLFSEVAPVRIKDLLPEVRLIFMLRDPVARAYSQYWHMVKSGRTTVSFERAIHTHPAIVLGSTYLPHLERYRRLFAPERIMVVLFEDFIAEPQATVDRVTDYLGAARMEVKPGASWFNRTSYPTSLGLQLALNHVGKRVVGLRYSNHLESRSGLAVRIGQKLHHLWFGRVNPLFLGAERAPPMRPKTKAYLSEHLSTRNRGLSELLGRDLAQIWPGFRG